METFFALVSTLEIDPNLKNDLMDRSSIKGHILYINLVNYLLPLYPQIEEAKAKRLSLSGYLYFRFLLFLDNYIDTSTSDTVQNNGDNFQKLVVSFEFYEKAIQGLSELFPEGSKFWLDFSKLKKEYFEIVRFEKEISLTKPSFSEETFLKIASGKSSICDAMVYALATLGETEAHTAKLLACLHNIHIGLQYLDDVEDFKKDIQGHQWTYPQYLVREYLKKNNLVITDTPLLHKHLYLSGIASKLVDKSIYHLESGIDMAKNLNLFPLAELLEKKKSACQIYYGEIDLLIEKAEIKVRKGSLLKEKQSIPNAIALGATYLENTLDQNYAWTDFLTSAGFGKAWITGYVGLQLAESNLHPDLLKVVLTNSIKDMSASSFNDEMTKDGDSTTFLRGFQRRVRGTVTQDQLTSWLRFMNDDGGWVTYRDGQELIDKLKLEKISVKGWITSKCCVTAAAAYVLSFFDELEVAYKKTCYYLIKNISKDGYWNSYWWTSSVYATSFSIMALSASKEFKHHARAAVVWLREKQHPDGYWVNETANGNEPSPFYSSLALKALLIFDPVTYKENILKVANWLLQNQTIDGSWLTSRILRIPATDIEDPTPIKNWRMSSFGVNCLVDDHNRVFTTATVVNALALFDTLFCNDIDSMTQYKADTEKPLNRVGYYN